MFFKIEKEIFVKSLQKIQGIIEKRNTMPILSNVLINAENTGIEIIATDLEVTHKGNYEAKVEQTGKITINAKKIYEIIKEFPDQEIIFTTKENDWVEIICGKVKFNIVGLPAEEFPNTSECNNDGMVEIEASVLRSMIEKTMSSICNDETKYNLNGIFIKIDQNDNIPILKFVATDGHRLSIASRSINNITNEKLQSGVILPKKGIYELKKILDEGDGLTLFGFVDNCAYLKKGENTLVMRLVDGDFPDYSRVIPVSNDQIVKLNRENLSHAVKRMAILSSDKFKGIMLEIDSHQLKISSNNPELGDASEELDIIYEGLPFSVRFNAKYLLDVLSVCDTENIIMKFKNELSPSIVTPDNNGDFLSVIMPMRL